MLPTQGTTVLRPVKKIHTSTKGTVNQEVIIMAKTINLVHHSKVILTQIKSTLLRDLVLGQFKIYKNLTRKFLNSDKFLENINIKVNNLASSVKN